ncbi:MAG TPA: NADP-dependent oxidoreductase, partial [Actinopolymorphaceae bacterium]
MATMYAVRAHVRGGPERLVYETVPRPEPAKGEMLIAVHAAAVTAGELAWDATWTDRLDGSGHDRTPVIPAHEVSGTVAAIAEGAAAIGGLQLGDPVFGLLPFTRDGAAAEYVTAPAELLAPKPEALDHVHAAALPLAGSTAWQALHDYAHVEPGHHVLV